MMRENSARQSRGVLSGRGRAGLFLLVLALCSIPTAASAWWQNDWSYRKQITIDTSPKGGNIPQSAGRVPLLIRLYSGNFRFGDAQENGNDIRFVAADDKTPLAFHIESFDPLMGVATIWVDVPQFPGGGTKDIWLYYGNKKATPGADAAGTFDPDYTLVYHFDDATGSPPHDKTAYANNAQSAPPALDDGSIIGKGARFTGAGATATVAIPASPSLAVKPGGGFTFGAWVKTDAPQPHAAIYARHDGGSALIVGLDNGAPFVELSGGATAHIAAAQPVAKGQWTHIAVTADGRTLTLYVNGRVSGSAAAALPAFNSPATLGGDAQNAAAPYVGEMDEVRLSRVARSPALIDADVLAQGPGSKLIGYGVDEKQSGFGFGYFGIIIKSVTIDAWVVITILGIMAVISWLVMWSKGSYVGSVDKANDRFIAFYRKHGGDPFTIEQEIAEQEKTRRRLGRSSIYRVFNAGSEEIRRRATKNGVVILNAEAIEVIRALMDATLVRENQRLSRNMVLLTISISGGPFLGLLGTVVGVMITFAAIAASGDVNINAIAPGISAALLATVAGLAVAIPALFGYNYLLTRIKNITANMQVFVDEFVTRISEIYHERAYARAAE
jgi:biopolymer transport protein ExbB